MPLGNLRLNRSPGAADRLLKLGGYTDNTGDKALNLKLSADRAATVVGELVKMGIEPARLASKDTVSNFRWAITSPKMDAKRTAASRCG